MKCLLLAALLCTSLMASAEIKKITAAADPWPPFVDPNSKTQGLSLEIIRAAMATQKIEVEMNFVPWARAEADVKAGTTDIPPNTWLTEERLKDLTYSDPYASNEVKFIKRKGDAFEFNGIDSLAGKTVGIVQGYGYGDEFLKSTKFKKDASTDIVTNIKKLNLSRIDLTLDDQIVVSALLQKEDPSLLSKIEFTKNALTVNKLHITTGKKNKNGAEIIAAFNKGLAEIKANGKLAEIFKKYGIN